MSGYKYTLETNTLELAFDSTRRKRVLECPLCGKSNKDGKFVPYVGFTDRGHCFSCGQYSPVGEHTCPSCKAEKAFNRYFVTETSEYIQNHVGKCLVCGYHYPPKEYFQSNVPTMNQQTQRAFSKPVHSKPAAANTNIASNPTSFIPDTYFKASLKNHDQNNFVLYLNTLFGTAITNQLVGKYFIGTSRHWSGANVFWQIDSSGKIRAGKIMAYDATTGKRIKIPLNHIAWVHSVLSLPDFKLNQCLFGEHLLKDKTKPVAIVESEKTAIIASIYLPQFLWLAVGGKEGLNPQKCKVLSGRSVTLFPDLNAFQLWTAKAKELSKITKFSVSELLELNATPLERSNGLDIADYLIRFNFKQFLKQQEEQKSKPISVAPLQVHIKAANTSSNPSIPIPSNASSGPSFSNSIILSPHQTSVIEPAEMQIPSFSNSLPPSSHPQISTSSNPSINPLPHQHINKLTHQHITPLTHSPETWSLNELETFFSSIQLPQTPIQLNQCTLITNASKFIEGHMSTVRRYDGVESCRPYFNRLKTFQQILIEQQA